MHNKFGFQICDGRKMKRLMEIIEKRVYKKEYKNKEEIMSSFFNLINMKTKLSEKIRKIRKAKQTELLFYLFDQQNDNLIKLCKLLIDILDISRRPKKLPFIPHEINIDLINVEIKLGNQLISDIMDLIKNYDNKMTRHPRCHHYKNKIHTQLFTELGDILICKECVGTIEAWCTYVKDYRLNIKNTRMRELRTPPF